MSGEPPAWADIPEPARRRIRAKMLELLGELGITPMADPGTGELLIPFAEVAAKLGLSMAEATAALEPGDLRTVDPDTLEPMQ